MEVSKLSFGPPSKKGGALMAKKKSKSFNKHIYSLIAVVVLLVAAGIASYAAAPAGSATHGTLYTNTLFLKDRSPSYQVIDVNDTLYGNKGVRGISNYNVGIIGISNLDATADGGAIGVVGQATRTNGAGVKGENTVSGNKGLLGTANAGVEGIADGVTKLGVYGKQGALGSFAIKGENTGSGNYGQIGGGSKGVEGYSVSGYGVTGSTGLIGLVGVEGFTSNPAGYAGKFTGGKGLYASKIEFGSDAFNYANNQGLLILGVRAGITTTCSAVCSTHNLGCIAAYKWDAQTTDMGCLTSSGIQRYCWCD